MAINYNPRIVTNGLVLTLDAANPRSIPTDSLISVEILIVGGGGAGSVRDGGAGGAGGVISSSVSISAQSYPIIVGAGGVGVTSIPPVAGEDGQPSSAFGLVAIGGGGGGQAGQQGRSGGSGGGNGGGTSGLASGGLGTAGQGFNGGRALVGPYTGAGGGGAGGPGSNVTVDEVGSNGGPGIQSSISGTAQFYAGGGGGSGITTNGIGGSGVGGNGSGGIATSGAPNTGSGGGSSRNTGGTSGSGGSGVVIIRYYGPQKAAGGTITFAGGYTIHTFTTSGIFVPAKSNNTWKDLSGNGNDGVLVNGPTYSPEQGGCIVFNNTNNYVNIPQNSTINLISTFTASVWVKITNLTDSHEIISKGNGLSGNGDFGWALSYYNVSNTIYFDTHSTSTRYVLVAPFNTSAWKNITVTFNNGTKFIYVDGVQLATATDAHTIGNTSYDFRISESATWPALAGNVSCVTMYNRALSAAEIRQNFNALRGRYGV